MSGRSPRFSVVVPTRGRAARLEACLEALYRLDPPEGGFEAVVVDDGGDRSLPALVDRYCRRLDVRLVSQPRAGPAVARNTGARHAGGEVLAFTDDDCEPAAGWLRGLDARLGGRMDVAVGGRSLNALPHNPYASARQAIVDMAYDRFNADPDHSHFFSSCNLAVPTQGFEAIGGFDEAFSLVTGEDRDFCQRWRDHGKRLVYAPEAVVHHSRALGLRSFWLKHLAYGRGAYRFHRARGARGGQRLRPDVSFYTRIFALPFSQRGASRAAVSFGLLSLAQVANTAGFAFEALATRLRARDRA